MVRLALLNAGIVAVLSGVSGGLIRLAVAGAALVVAAVLAHVASLLAMIRSSPLAGPLAVVVWYYIAAGAALAAGGTLGGVLAWAPVRSPRPDTAAVAALLASPYLGGISWLAAVGMAAYLAGATASLMPAVLEIRAKPPRTAAAWGCWRPTPG